MEANQKQVGFAPIVIVLAIIAVLAAGGAGVWYFTQTAPKPAAAQNETVVQSVTHAQAQTAASDTANWQTYRNEELGIEIKYPSGWNIKGNEIHSSGSAAYLAISRLENPKNLSFDDWWKENTIISGRPTVLAGSEDITINGIKAKIAYAPEGKSGWLIDIADSQNRIFSLAAEGLTVDKQIFDQMLSTFRFIEPQAVVAKTEILARVGKDLRGQAEKVQLADGTMCVFVNGATTGNAKNERLNYQCGDNKNLSMAIYGDLVVGDVWTANVSNIEYDAAKKEWNVLSTKTVDIAKVWR
jgi:hypothetical protein